jgi:hypothetical protein
MNNGQNDCYLVFLRADRAHTFPPEECERYLTSCSTYGDARRIQREFRYSSRECVIRYEGETGGGD